MDNIEKLLYLRGIAADYLDYSEQYQVIPRDVRERVLKASGYDVSDSGAIENAIYQLDARPWQSWLKTCYILAESNPAQPADIDVKGAVFMHVHPDQLGQTFCWSVQTEQGDSLSGDYCPQEFPEVGDYVISGVRYSRRALVLPPLPLGYHELQLRDGGGRSEAAELIVCPDRCYSSLGAADKAWGVSCQLYTLRSDHNCGIGDFADLKELVQLSVAAGADYIGLNPLHAACADSPDAASPYSPSDRRFLNAIYIALADVDEFTSPVVQQWFADKLQITELARLRKLDFVDYDGVNRFKYACLELMFAEFLRYHLATDSGRGRAFSRFVEQGADDLQSFTAYECQHNRYARQFGSDPRFYCYLQWLAATQLGVCHELALEAGMRIGLLGDLAVGAVAKGCEVTSNPDLYIATMTIGAPPDPLAPNGQDWGLPVLDPVALKISGFRHFRTLLKANMKNYGALRVDHAMALLRLWWCLPQCDHEAASGAYVYYPIDDLLALIRLESVRNQCMIIGEDLGLVPADFSEAIEASGLYSNNLLYFEQVHDAYFTPPEQQQVNALLMVTNHDVPTLCDWWNGTDLQRRFVLGLKDVVNDLEGQIERRKIEKQKLLNWLVEADLLPESYSPTDIQKPFDYALCIAIHKASSRSASALLLLQLEDLQLMQDPVNIPGTYREYPNWRRKQRNNTAAIFAVEEAKLLLKSVREERSCDSQ